MQARSEEAEGAAGGIVRAFMEPPSVTQKTNKVAEQATGNPRTQRGAPPKTGLTVTVTKKSGSSHAVAPPTSSGAKVTQTCNSSAYHSQKPQQQHSAVRNNVKCVASEFSTVVAQHKKMKSSASTSHLNGCIARKTQQKLIACTFNTLCSDYPSSKITNGEHARHRQSTSKGRKPGPPEIIRPQKLSQPLTPKVAAGKQASLQQLYCQAEDEQWATPVALVGDFDEGNDESAAYTVGPRAAQSRPGASRDRSAVDVAEIVERLQARVAELEQQLEEERQDNIEKDIQIQQLQEIVKLKDLQIREYQIEKAMAATMRKQQARTSLLELDRQSSLLKQVRPTTGSCTHESRDDGGRPGRNPAVNRTQPTQDAGRQQSPLTTTLNLDDGALSAENVSAVVHTDQALGRVRVSEDDLGLQKALVARKEGVDSNLQECLTQQNSEKSTKNHLSGAKARLDSRDGGGPQQSAHIEDEELEPAFPEEVPQPTVNIVSAPKHRQRDRSDDGRRQLLGEGERPEDYIQANFFDQQVDTIDFTGHCDAVEMVPEPQIIDQRDFKGTNRLLQTLQPAQTNSTFQAPSPRGSQESAWQGNRSFKVATTKYRSPEEEWQDSKSSLYASKSAQGLKQPDPIGQSSGQLLQVSSHAHMPGTPGAVGRKNEEVNASIEVRLELGPRGALPGPAVSRRETEQLSVHSLNLSTSITRLQAQEGTRPPGGSTEKSPLSVRSKNAQSWRKGSAVQDPRKVSNHLQYQTSSALLGSRPGRKQLALSVKPGPCAKGGRTPTNAAQNRPGSYLNHLQKQYASKTSAINSSAAPSSVGQSLDKVAVNVPSITARSPGGKRSPVAPEVSEATPEAVAHSFRADGKPRSAAKVPIALARQGSSGNIQQVQNCRVAGSSSGSKIVPAKASQSFVELSKRPPMLPSPNGADSVAHVGQGRQAAPNSQIKSGQKPPSRGEAPLEEPLLTQRGASARGFQGLAKEAPGIGGPGRRKASEQHVTADAKNQTQKLSSRKLGITTPTLSQRGGATARQSKQSQSTCQPQPQSAATQRKSTQPASGHKVPGDGQGLTQRLLNSQRISTCRLGQPSSRKQLNQAQAQNQQASARVKTAITEPIMAHMQSAGSHHMDSSSEKSKQRARRVKKAQRINKNEVLFQQVLKTCREREESAEGYQGSDLVSGAPREYSHESRSRSDRSRLEQSRISLHRSSENSQMNLQANAEKERSQYLDRTLPRDDGTLWGRSDEPTGPLIQPDDPYVDDLGRGDSSQVLGVRGPTGSAAASDCTSQCNYRTREGREENAGQAQLSSRASGNISGGDGQTAAHGTTTGSTSLTILTGQRPSSKGLHQRGDYSITANYYPQEGSFDGAGARKECREAKLMYDFNLLSPLKQGTPELLNDSGDQEDSDPNTWAQQHSLNVAELPQPTHREPLPAITCQQSQMFQMSPSSAGALCSPHFQQTQLTGLQPLPPLYALQGSTDFDVIYEKNSTEEMETSILSKSRMSKVSRISRLCPETQAQLDSQMSVSLQEQQFTARTGAQNTSRLRHGDKLTKRHGPTLSGGTSLGLGLTKVAASCDWQETNLPKTARGRPHLSSGTNFENEGVLGTNYEDSAGAEEIEEIEENKGSYKKELCDRSINKEGQKSSQAASSSRAKRVFELKDAIKKDQDNFLMEEILASHAETTPARQRRSRSQRRDGTGGQSGKSPPRSSRGKREYCTQAYDAAPVQPFDGNEFCNIKTATRTIPRTGQRATRTKQSKLSGCVLGSRAPEKRRGTDVSGTSEYQTATGPLKVNESDDGPAPLSTPAREVKDDSQGDEVQDNPEYALKVTSREELETNVQAAQECLEVLDQSLHNFMDEGQARELPGSAERSRNGAVHAHQSSIMEEQTWQGESIRAHRASRLPSDTNSKERIGTVATNERICTSGQEKDTGDGQMLSERDADEAGELQDSAKAGHSNNSQDVVDNGTCRSHQPSSGHGTGRPDGRSCVRTSNPDDEANFFKMENDGFYAYSGAFETFNNVAPGSGPQATEGPHTMTLLLQTARSAEGSFVKSDRSPTGFVLSPVSLAGASGNQQQPCQLVTSVVTAEGQGGIPAAQRPPNSRASDARSHNISVLTLQNLPAASSGRTHRSNGGGEIMAMKKTSAVALLMQMPGVFYQLVSELLGEKLPLIIFTNRHSFKVSLDTMIARYANCQQQIIEHKDILQRELAALHGIQVDPPTPSVDGTEMDRYAISTIPEEDCDPQPSNSQQNSSADPEAASSSAAKQSSQFHESVSLPEYTDEQLEGELLEITQVELVYDGIIENIKRFRRIVV